MSSPNRSIELCQTGQAWQAQGSTSCCKGAPIPQFRVRAGAGPLPPASLQIPGGTDMVNWLELAGIMGTSSRRRHSTEKMSYREGRQE